jgi:hypothetical protein
MSNFNHTTSSTTSASATPQSNIIHNNTNTNYNSSSINNSIPFSASTNVNNLSLNNLSQFNTSNNPNPNLVNPVNNNNVTTTNNQNNFTLQTLKRRANKVVVPLDERVTLEKAFGFTTTSNTRFAQSCDGLIAYLAGCVIVLYDNSRLTQEFIISTARKTLTTVAFSLCGRYLATGEVIKHFKNYFLPFFQFRLVPAHFETLRTLKTSRMYFLD